MSKQWFESSVLAQDSVDPSLNPPPAGFSVLNWVLLSSTLLLALALAGVIAYGKSQINKANKATKFEQFKTKELQKKLKLALKTIQQMETNPDLVHSREFNLDYLRMRMDEDVFHFAIINQVKVRVKQIVSIALRPNVGAETSVGIANAGGRKIDETFDIVYNSQTKSGQPIKAVLFRINIKLTKLPTQSTSATVNQIIECIEKYLNPSEEHLNWQPTLQGRIAEMHWDQKAKPTPLLVLEQTVEGGNVTIRSDPNRRIMMH